MDKSVRFFTGIDGCRGGWFAVKKAGDSVETILFPGDNHDTLLEICRQSELVLIDIPIGLPDGRRERESDVHLRQLLGKRGASIFPIPVREAVYASTYQEACMINRKVRNKAFPIQTWNIMERIRSADRFLSEYPRYKFILRESSPEYCYRLLSGIPLGKGKRSSGGAAERIGVLNTFLPAGDFLEKTMERYRRKDCTADDILDAGILAVTAELTAERGVLAVPPVCSFDSRGLPIQAIFCNTDINITYG